MAPTTRAEIRTHATHCIVFWLRIIDRYRNDQESKG